MKYIKQLDSIRAIAVILVVISHWAPYQSEIRIYTSFFSGVDIFFVLSGFLITGILINNRIESDNLGNSKTQIMKSFFFRRMLRIFPVYYLSLLFIYLMGEYSGTDIRNNYMYFLTYTSNIYFHYNGWDEMLSPYWSLSVEEQFYIFWPWLIIFINKKYFLPLILLAITIGFISQNFFLINSDRAVLTHECLDAFGIGALIAWVWIFNPRYFQSYYPFILILGLFGIIFPVANLFGYVDYLYGTPRTFASLFIGWIIIEVILKGENKRFFLNIILNNKTLIFMGKISYGMYILHMIIQHITHDFLSRLNQFFPPAVMQFKVHIEFMENFLLLLLFSYLSWKWIEQPILFYKKNFEYQQKPSVVLTKTLVK